MHAINLAEVAAWVAIHSQNLVSGEQHPTAAEAKGFWVESKCRISRWNSTLKMFDADLREPDPNHNPWPAFEIVIQEIIISEMLTRIMAASFVISDIKQDTTELSGLGQSNFISHMETKNRAIRTLLHAQGANEAAFDRINQLRRQIERWTDLFLSRMSHPEVSARFGFDAQRVRDFASELPAHRDDELNRKQQILLISMKRNLKTITGKFTANPDLNRKIASEVMGCFLKDRFDCYGLPKSAKLLWLEKSHDDTSTLVEQLNEFEDQATEDSDWFAKRSQIA